MFLVWIQETLKYPIEKIQVEWPIQMGQNAEKERADIVLGNRSYTTCSREHTFFFKRFFERHGFSVAINDPYSGKYILGYHCSRKHLPGIQIEINRKHYMDENSLQKNPKRVRELNALIKEVVKEFYEKFLK